MKDLQILADVLKSMKYKGGVYYIPKSWNYLNLDAAVSSKHPGEVSVNPYAFYAECLDTILHVPAQNRKRDQESSVVYTINLRTFFAWNHSGNKVENGSFLKAIALLPLLIQQGVDTICLEPIFSTNISEDTDDSIYPVRDFMKIDNSLHDPNLSDISPEDEFNAFMQACHHLGILVIMKFVFHTAASDSSLIRNHPEWFYWVKADDNGKSPALVWPKFEDLNDKTLEKAYKTRAMIKYVKHFAEAPSRNDWRDIIEESDFLNEDLHSVSARRLGIVPADFSTSLLGMSVQKDCTCYRMFFDNTPAAVKVFPHLNVPFLADDGADCRSFPGKLPNYELWHFFESVIAYYQDTYDLDGAYIENGKMLPVEMMISIIKKTRKKYPEFIFCSDERNAVNAYDASNEGYDFIRGELDEDWRFLSSDEFGNRLFQHLDSALPVMAALETKNNPSIFSVMEKESRVEAVFWIAALIPNSVLLIRGGMGMEELSFNSIGKQQKVLDWHTTDSANSFREDLLLASQLRKIYKEVLQPENLDLRLFMADTPVLVLKYQTEDKQFLAVINRTEKLFKVMPERLIDGERKVFYSHRATVHGEIGEYGILIMGSLIQDDAASQEQSAPYIEDEPEIEEDTPQQPVDDELLPDFIFDNTNEKRVAYFSMEFALDSSLEIYSGEAGIISGDILKTAMDMEKPMVGVGILWRQGFGRQLLRQDGTVIDCFPENSRHDLKDTGVTVTIPIRGRNVLLKIWLCNIYDNAPLYLLDSSQAKNADDRLLTGQLYGRFEEERLAQEMILGIGGVMALRALGIDVDIYHLNDSYAVLAGVKLMEDQIGCGCLFEQAFERTRNKIVFTSHTPSVCDSETHSLELLKYMGAFKALDEREMVYLGGNPFNMTVAGLRMSHIANGLSSRHSRQLRDMWSNIPDSPIITSITGGMHIATWMDRSVAEAAHKHEGIMDVHRVLKQNLFDEIERHTGYRFDENVLTIGMAYAVSDIQRNELLFHDFERIEPLIKNGKLQIVMAGKAHPNDLDGKKLLVRLYQWSTRYPKAIAFMQDYDLISNRLLTQGCDIWLDTARAEVCGASGIMAAMNGVLPLGVPEGWWAEACEHGVNGWQFGDSNHDGNDKRECTELLDTLIDVIIPLYNNEPDKWAEMMYSSINIAYKQFSSVRMLREYYIKLYKPQEATQKQS